MANDSSSSDVPFGEVDIPQKKKTPFTVAPKAKPKTKAAAAAASVRANIMEPDEDFAGTPQVQRLKTKEEIAKEPLGELPEIDEFARPPEPASPPQDSGEIPQLVLKAIFGVSQEMDQAEILRRAGALPQIKSVTLVGESEREALGVLQRSFGGNESLAIRVGGNEIDFIKEPGVTLAVLTTGGYAAGVRETLIIVARELARLI